MILHIQPCQGLRVASTTQLCCLHFVHHVNLLTVFNTSCLVVMGTTVVVITCSYTIGTLLACVSQVGVQIVTWSHLCVEVNRRYCI